MTRQDFIDNIDTVGELMTFCYNEGIEDFIDDIYTSDSRDEAIRDRIDDYLYNGSWSEVRDYLRDLEDSLWDEYYLYDDWDGWRIMDDDDLERRINDVIEYMDENDLWDEEEHEDPISVSVDESALESSDDFEFEDEDFGIDGLFVSPEEIEAKEAEEDTDPIIYDEFFGFAIN